VDLFWLTHVGARVRVLVHSGRQQRLCSLWADAVGRRQHVRGGGHVARCSNGRCSFIYGAEHVCAQGDDAVTACTNNDGQAGDVFLTYNLGHFSSARIAADSVSVSCAIINVLVKLVRSKLA
jgi:hypothetical protein